MCFIVTTAAAELPVAYALFAVIVTEDKFGGVAEAV
jgi:hypothetical protein